MRVQPPSKSARDKTTPSANRKYTSMCALYENL